MTNDQLSHHTAWKGTSGTELKVAKQTKYKHRDQNLVLLIAWARIIGKATIPCPPKGLGRMTRRTLLQLFATWRG